MKVNFVIIISAAALSVLFAKESTRNRINVKPGGIWEDCSSPGSRILTLEKISIIPNPTNDTFKLDEDIIIYVTYKLTEDLTNNAQIYIDFNVPTYGVQTLSVQFCTALSYIKFGCPLKKTDNGMMNVSLGIPPDAPVGSYTGKATIKDENGAEVLCISLKFEMASGLQPYRLK